VYETLCAPNVVLLEKSHTVWTNVTNDCRNDSSLARTVPKLVRAKCICAQCESLDLRTGLLRLAAATAVAVWRVQNRCSVCQQLLSMLLCSHVCMLACVLLYTSKDKVGLRAVLAKLVPATAGAQRRVYELCGV
jgi:hypothetical protein